MALKTNREGRTGGLSDAIRGAGRTISMSQPAPDVVSGKLIGTMMIFYRFCIANRFRKSGLGGKGSWSRFCYWPSDFRIK